MTKAADGARSALSAGLGAWVDAEERMPTEDETIDGRVPAIDEDGFLVFAILVCGKLIGTSNIGIDFWLPVKAPNASVSGPREAGD